MQPSKYNITSKVKDSDHWFVVNPLSGQADILDQETYEQIKNGFEGKPELIENGYLVDPLQEKRLFREKYLQFLDDREKDEIQIFFVTNYSCNFDCSYCYQAGYEQLPVSLSKEITDEFFDYIQKEFSGRRKYITLFGGEPFLNAPKHKEHIAYIIEKAASLNLEIAAVTNGFNLEEYIPILKKGIIREIQVTLDGTSEIHNQRRYLKGGDPTFDRIVRGVDMLLENNFPLISVWWLTNKISVIYPIWRSLPSIKAGQFHHFSKPNWAVTMNCTSVRLTSKSCIQGSNCIRICTIY